MAQLATDAGISQRNLSRFLVDIQPNGRGSLFMACLRTNALLPNGPTVWLGALGRAIHGTAAAGRLAARQSA